MDPVCVIKLEPLEVQEESTVSTVVPVTIHLEKQVSEVAVASVKIESQEDPVERSTEAATPMKRDPMDQRVKTEPPDLLGDSSAAFHPLERQLDIYVDAVAPAKDLLDRRTVSSKDAASERIEIQIDPAELQTTSFRCTEADDTQEQGQGADIAEDLVCDPYDQFAYIQPPVRVKTSKHVKKTCPECGMVCSSSTGLQYHLRIHTGEKPFECTECGKVFRGCSGLASHIKCHTGYKRHECKICNKTFSSISYLKRHLSTHVGVKKFGCPDCDKRFITPSHLSTHRRLHTGERPYHCSDCSKKFASSSALVCHRRTHTGEKPFQCSDCSKTFTQLSNLISHRRIHTGETPFECPDCKKRFNHQANLIKHRKKCSLLQAT